MQYLVGTDSVHTTAAICDYLAARATATDAVSVGAVAPSDEPTVRRDCQEALNVATVRLATVGDIDTVLREGDPASELLEAAAEIEADELVVGVGGDACSSERGSTVSAVLDGATRPVVVVPLSEL
ncbi:universal stress protein [Salinadaptatus halalkaliphilus]|uniref:Universal stress protein n=1 Tax=Salinadaptatus halalkaliphilus TaxID=2419781 RepID=A0A4S3TJS4_9EURY|nr:universal stress protein [Salinadaptatus halalkaliphilus]THE64349.1 universal stress protein [Salinadaptatus halalkaliphilus]